MPAAPTWLRDVRIVAITDRRLMVPADVLARGELAEVTAAFGRAIARALVGLAPGVVLVQVREKEVDGAALLALARAAVAAARAAGQHVIVNDRVDVAVIADADGAHLPERGLPLAAARDLARVASRPFVLGASRHDRAGVLASAVDAADLVHLGPIWPTPSKAGTIDALGADALAVRRELSPHARLVAVGGIDSPARAAAARTAGADAIAAIRAIWSAPDPAAAVAGLVGLA